MAPIPVPAKSFAIIQTYHTVAVDSRMAALSTSADVLVTQIDALG